QPEPAGTGGALHGRARILCLGGLGHYNHARYHESLVYFGRAEAVLLERERIKRQTIANRRLQHHLHAA
ncbi:MAG: hypothetical protein WAN05_11240, partial [Roseiarcus sp.]